uniref:NADH-ubiquinone oxidoreductase chain 1 n=1 Tax=Ceratosolen solmsi TaxID=142686 RepID=I1SVG3_9HYME|nr:NADH dehydrogenase subunit 1 [Ceratosolen solmsi]
MMLVMLVELLVLVLVSISFLTLLERKLLSYMQLRKGPNKTGFIGLLQPFSDGVKLFTKEFAVGFKVNRLLYYMCPLYGMLLMFSCWTSLPYTVNFMSHGANGLLIICILSAGVYLLIFSGWFSSTPLGMLGSIRSVAQTISYEVSLIFIIYSVLMLAGGFDLFELYETQKFSWFILTLPISAFMFFVSMLAELNRTPFDLSEGESELVSGFNTEYGASIFSLFFLAEYGMIMFMGFMFSLFFLGGKYFCWSFYVSVVLIIMVIIWVRGTFPRMRYDHVMTLVCKDFLFLIFGVLVFVCCLLMILLD